MNDKQEKIILLFTNTLKGGGAETIDVALIEAYLKQKYKCVVVSLHPSNIDIKNPDLDLINLNLKMPKNPFSSLFMMFFLRLYLNKNKQWNYFLDKYSGSSFCLIKASLPLSHKAAYCSPFRDKTIYSMQVSFDIIPFWFKRIHTFIMNKFYKNKKIVCVSKGIKQEIINNWKVNENDVSVIYNPVPLENQFSNKKSINPSKPYFIVVGRLVKQKNITKAIDIFNEGKFYQKFDLIICGEGPQRRKIEKLVNKYNLDDHIKLMGFCDNAAQLIEEAKLMLCTSKQEGFPITFLEALSVGTPVLSIDCPTGPSEILTGELSNYLIPFESENSVYISKINEVLDGKYPKITKQFLEPFQLPLILKQYLNFYKF